MSHDRQLSLLDWTPPLPPRKVIPFPRTKRVDEIRTIAKALHTKKERQANRAWNDKINQIRRQMMRAGFDDGEIDRQVELFRAAVQSELDRLVWVESRGHGGVA